MAPDKHSPELLLLVKSTCQKSEGPKNLPPVLPVYPWQPARSPTCWGWVGGDLVASLQPPPPWTPWRSLCCYRGHQARELLRQGEEERAKSFQLLFCCSNTGKQASKQKPKPKAQQNDPTRKARVCVCVCVCPRLGAGVGSACESAAGVGRRKADFPTFSFQQLAVATQAAPQRVSGRELGPQSCASSPVLPRCALRPRPPPPPSQGRGCAPGRGGAGEEWGGLRGLDRRGSARCREMEETLGKRVGGGAPWRGPTLRCPRKETRWDGAATRRQSLRAQESATGEEPGHQKCAS